MSIVSSNYIIMHDIGLVSFLRVRSPTFMSNVLSNYIIMSMYGCQLWKKVATFPFILIRPYISSIFAPYFRTYLDAIIFMFAVYKVS